MKGVTETAKAANTTKKNSTNWRYPQKKIEKEAKKTI